MQKGICPHCGEPITVERGFRIHTEMGADFKEKKSYYMLIVIESFNYSKNVDELVLLTQAYKCLSRVRGNSHARFLEGKAVVIPLTYSTRFWRTSRNLSARS